MLNRLLPLLLLIAVTFSCQNGKVEENSVIPSKKQVVNSDLDWISGTWIDSTSFKAINQTYVEVWKVIDKNEYKGIKYAIRNGKNGDTTQLKINQSEGKYYYTIGEDKEKSTFIQTKNSVNEIGFSNTKDEFPYDLVYSKKQNNLTITASGSLNGEQKSIKFSTLKID